MTFETLLILYALIFACLVFFEALYTYYYFGFSYGFSSNRDKSANLGHVLDFGSSEFSRTKSKAGVLPSRF